MVNVRVRTALDFIEDEYKGGLKATLWSVALEIT